MTLPESAVSRAEHSLYLSDGTVDPIWPAHICPSPPRARTLDKTADALTTELWGRMVTSASYQNG